MPECVLGSLSDPARSRRDVAKRPSRAGLPRGSLEFVALSGGTVGGKNVCTLRLVKPRRLLIVSC